MPLSGPLRGALWMTASMVFFSAMTLVIRYLSPNIPPWEQVFIRGIFSMMFVLPWLLRTGIDGLRTSRAPLLAVRAACTGGGILFWIYGIVNMPLAEAVSLHFTIPLFSVLLAILILGERVGRHRWTALAVGFSGALIILRPGVEAVNPVALVIMLSAAIYALGNVISKILVRTEPASLIVFYINAFLVIGFAVPSAIWWVAPSLREWGLLAIFGLGNVLAQLCINKAFAAADVSFVIPFEFTRLPMLALAGFVLFGEEPGVWTWAGALVIFGAAYYIARRERGH